MDQVVAKSRPAANGDVKTVPNSPDIGIDNDQVQTLPVKDVGLIGSLQPLNQLAKNSFHRLAYRRHDSLYEHHCRFIDIDSLEGDAPKLGGTFSLSLSKLPEFARLGWRIGRGRKDLPNFGVDLLLFADDNGEDGIAGIHARFAWVKGGGGFFLIADNKRGKAVTLNGEVLSHEQRLIPFRNTIGIGECYFTFKFPKRTAAQEEQFQAELADFYTVVLKNSVPLIAPTPCENMVTMGDWVVRNAIAKGSFGHVYAVTHRHTGEAAAAKELWRTPYNSKKVNEEVSMAKRLLAIKHKYLATPFQFREETVHNKIEKERMFRLLDDTWRPGSNDVVNKYIFFSPLSTSTFYSLIASKASQEVRTTLFTQVLEGLAFLHREGIAHRDIKPGNLTVVSYDPPWARIVDYGSATFQDPILYDWPGTIPYLAPEQRQGEYHGRPVDYWACALVGAEVLGYKLPTKPSRQLNKEDLEIAMKWLNEKPSHALRDCCQAMLQWDPAKRMTADYALQHLLAQYREKSVTKKRPLTE